MRIIIIILIFLIVAGVIGLAFVNAKDAAYDKKTIADIEKISEALKIYFDVNGYYPTSVNNVPNDIEKYLSFYPTNDNCSYSYERKSSGDDYTLTCK